MAHRRLAIARSPLVTEPASNRLDPSTTRPRAPSVESILRPPVVTTSLGALAQALGGTVEGDPELPITGAAGVEDAAPGDLVRVDGERWLAPALASPAVALLVPPDLPGVTRPAIRVAHPRLAFARALAILYPERVPPPGVHPSAIVAEDTLLGEGCVVMAGAIVGARARLGRSVILHPGVVVGEDVVIGDETVLFPRVTIYPRVALGARVRIHAGSVLGGDGFGYVLDKQTHKKIPHLGAVLIEDDVEIGANTCIDRATTGITSIGAGTKIDNLVQIGHNCRIGRGCLVAGQAGLSGSVTLEDGVVIAGGAKLRDNITIVTGVIVGGASAVWGDQRAPGQISGAPARPHREHLQVQAALGRLPELLRQVASLARRIARLEGGGGSADLSD
jgi:UDP-3-O-[3-hydroxymyristoyl] glucosamine N-acyltransferase